MAWEREEGKIQMANGLYCVLKLDDQTFHIEERDCHVFCTLLLGRDRALLFDTCNGFGPLPPVLRKITSLPIIVVNSHGHIDHAGGNFAFDQVYLHPADWELERTHCVEIKQRMLRGIDEGALPTLSSTVAESIRANRTAMKHRPEYLPLAEGQEFDLGGRVLTVIHVPGHTRGSVALYDTQNKTLLGGDAVNRHLWMFLSESASLEEMVRSLERLNSFEIFRVISSHTPDTLRAAIIRRLQQCAAEIDPDYDAPYHTDIVPDATARIHELGENSYDNWDYVSLVYNSK